MERRCPCNGANENCYQCCGRGYYNDATSSNASNTLVLQRSKKPPLIAQSCPVCGKKKLGLGDHLKVKHNLGIDIASHINAPFPSPNLKLDKIHNEPASEIQIQSMPGTIPKSPKKFGKQENSVSVQYPKKNSHRSDGNAQHSKKMPLGSKKIRRKAILFGSHERTTSGKGKKMVCDPMIRIVRPKKSQQTKRSET